MDPWKQPTAANSATSSTPAPSTGPTMAHLTKHDQQIADLQTAIQQVQETQKTTAGKLEHRIDQVEATVSQHADATRQTLQDFQRDFQDSFQAAMHQQDKKMQSTMQSTMDELKDLFIRAKRKKHPTKDGPPSEDDSM